MLFVSTLLCLGIFCCGLMGQMTSVPYALNVQINSSVSPANCLDTLYTLEKQIKQASEFLLRSNAQYIGEVAVNFPQNWKLECIPPDRPVIGEKLRDFDMQIGVISARGLSVSPAKLAAEIVQSRAHFNNKCRNNYEKSCISNGNTTTPQFTYHRNAGCHMVLLVSGLRRDTCIALREALRFWHEEILPPGCLVQLIFPGRRTILPRFLAEFECKDAARSFVCPICALGNWLDVLSAMVLVIGEVSTEVLQTAASKGVKVVVQSGLVLAITAPSAMSLSSYIRGVTDQTYSGSDWQCPIEIHRKVHMEQQQQFYLDQQDSEFRMRVFVADPNLVFRVTVSGPYMTQFTYATRSGETRIIYTDDQPPGVWTYALDNPQNFTAQAVLTSKKPPKGLRATCYVHLQVWTFYCDVDDREQPWRYSNVLVSVTHPNGSKSEFALADSGNNLHRGDIRLLDVPGWYSFEAAVHQSPAIQRFLPPLSLYNSPRESRRRPGILMAGIQPTHYGNGNFKLVWLIKAKIRTCYFVQYGPELSQVIQFTEARSVKVCTARPQVRVRVPTNSRRIFFAVYSSAGQPCSYVAKAFLQCCKKEVEPTGHQSPIDYGVELRKFLSNRYVQIFIVFFVVWGISRAWRALFCTAGPVDPIVSIAYRPSPCFRTVQIAQQVAYTVHESPNGLLAGGVVDLPPDDGSLLDFSSSLANSNSTCRFADSEAQTSSDDRDSFSTYDSHAGRLMN